MDTVCFPSCPGEFRSKDYEFPISARLPAPAHSRGRAQHDQGWFLRRKLTAFLNISDPPYGEDIIFIRELFRKELTQSDVGQRKGLVIPKMDAEEFFPNVNKAEETKGMLLRFLNQETNQWLDCRYNFYRSSQSYVLTKGWSKYAKANFLKEKDVIKFCECSKEMGECDERYIMIEIVKWGEEEKRGVDGGR